MTALDEHIEVMELLFRTGWTDGLPVVPPTRAAVDLLVEASGRPADTLIAEIPPLYGAATVEKVAANAVMAGCLPEYMPVVITALELLVHERFNVGGMQCSTHMATPLVIIHGPIRHELDVNCAGNVFGQGRRANAAIGRAVKLALVNIGGSRPGVTDKATLGHPGKYTYCMGENEEASPWEPFHVRRGLSSTDSAVTVFGAEGPHNINSQVMDSPYKLAKVIVSMMANLGSNHVYIQGQSLIVLCPEHAAVFGKAKWSVEDLQQFLFENARVPHRDMKLGGIYGPETDKYNVFPRWVDRGSDDSPIPVARRASDIQIVVAGGSAGHSAFIPGWGSRAITGIIET